MILKLVLCFIWLLFIPTIIGNFLIQKKENNILYSWILGNILQMGIFFLVSIPLILLKAEFTTLVRIYSILLIALTFIALLFHKKIIKFSINFNQKISIFKILVIICIIAQLFVKFEYANVNNDDSSFVSLSTSMIETNKMYLTGSNGADINKLPARRVLAPISAYYSTIAVLLNTHVTIVTHTIIPIVFIILAYSIYYYLGKKIFKEEDSIYIFLILFSALNLYAFSVKGANRYLLLYTWFGRAILAGIILPFIWKISLDAMNKEHNNILDWITLNFSVLAGSLCSQMAVPLIGCSIPVLALISSIRDKKISYLFKAFIAVIPCIIIGIIYLILK